MPRPDHLLLVIIGLLASSRSPVSAFTLTELKCQSTIGKEASRFVQRIHQTYRRCEDLKLETAVCDETRRADLVAKAADRLLRQLVKRCDAALVLSHLGFPGACPDADGPPFSATDLVSCMDDAHRQRAIDAVASDYPGDEALTLEELHCQHMIGIATEHFFVSALRTRERCLDRQRAETISPSVACREPLPPTGAGTGDADIDRRLAKAEIKLASRLASRCAVVSLEHLGFPAACADPDGPPFTGDDLLGCLGDFYRQTITDLVDFQYP